MTVIPYERNKKWVSYLYRTAQPFTLAFFRTWGIQQELVVQDLPATKVLLLDEPASNQNIFFACYQMIW